MAAKKKSGKDNKLKKTNKIGKKDSVSDAVCRKGDELVLTIDNIGTNGEGIGHFQGYTLFVKDALAGDVVRVQVLKTEKRYGYARLLEILQQSPWRVEPACPVARQCGGCQLQHCSYEKQLEWKMQKVADCISRIGKIPVCLPDDKPNERLNSKFDDKPNERLNSKSDDKLNERLGNKQYNKLDEKSDGQQDISMEQIQPVMMERILSMDKPYHYRNKAQFPVGYDKNGKLVAGFYASRTHSIIPCTDCAIQHPCNKVIVETVLNFMEQYGIAAYREKDHTGLVRHILTRVGKATGEVMVCLVINGSKLPHQEYFVEQLLHSPLEENLHIASICLNHNTQRTNVILGETITCLYGNPYIEDKIGSIRYQISPLSFYQVNPEQTAKLYETSLEFAGLLGGETVWDLYCGIGTISLFLAQKAAKVCGVEIVPEAVEDARKNAVLNGLDNVEFFVGAAEDVVVQQYEKSHGALKADVVILDPPRKGCDEKLLETVVRMEPKRIVYVSCDPATLARDLKYLSGRGYALMRVRACDMFGQSGHVETIVALHRTDM